MYARAEMIVLPATNSLRSNGSGGPGRPTELPQGPPPYDAATWAAGQFESSNVACCQPAVWVSVLFQVSLVTKSVAFPAESSMWSLPISPAAPALELNASTAMTLWPGCNAALTSMRSALRQESAIRGELASCCPLTLTVNPSSAVSR